MLRALSRSIPGRRRTPHRGAVVKTTINVHDIELIEVLPVRKLEGLPTWVRDFRFTSTDGCEVEITAFVDDPSKLEPTEESK